MEIRNIYGEIIQNPDLDKGKLIESFENIICKYKITKEGEGYYKTITEYPNGGKDVEWIETVKEEGCWVGYNAKGEEIEIDISIIPEDAAKELELPIYNPFLIYQEYTQQELKEQKVLKLIEQIEAIKMELKETDYIILKVVEGLITLDDCIEVREYRQLLRNQINILEKEIASLSLENDKIILEEENNG